MTEAEADVLCLWGDHLESPSLHHWLESSKDRHLLFLQEEEGGKCLQSPHPRIHFLSIYASEEVIAHQLRELLFLRFSYQSCCTDERESQAFEKIEKCRQSLHLVASDFRDMGAQIFSNHLTNFKLLNRAKYTKKLFRQLKQVPAIICGASPTLGSDIAELRKWQNRGLIFAGGSALNVLSSLNLHPHFTACIDPDSPISRFLTQHHFEAPLFYQSRVSHQLLAQVHGTKLWMPDSGSYPIDQWMHALAGVDDSPFDGGWNVATFCISLAEAMGCHPIILTGLELSTISEKVYGDGVEERVGLEFVEAVDGAGQKVYTKPDWLMAKEWLEEFAKSHPDLQLINSTHGGLEFQGIQRMSLSAAREQYGRKMLDTSGVIHTLLEELPFVCERDTQEIVGRVESSWQRCTELANQLLNFYAKSHPILPTVKGEGALLEVELEEEAVFQHFLDPLWQIWKPLILRSQGEGDLYLHRLLFFTRVLYSINP